MKLAIIVKTGPKLNWSLSTIKFNKFGVPTNYEIFICDNWVDGFNNAKQKNYKFGLFVKSGTVFTDLQEFISLIENYPHQGLIGHLIESNNDYGLDEQCFFLDLEKFQSDNFDFKEQITSKVFRSEENIHDDYTPLWLSSTNNQTHAWTGKLFGQGLLARQLETGIAVNWKGKFRDLKHYLYDGSADQEWLNNQVEYIKQAESQLWVFNNESMPIISNPNAIIPASGLCWIKNIIQDTSQTINLVDISEVQLDFAKSLWETWTGENYGQYTYDYIKQHELVHVNLDQPLMSDIDRLKLKSSKFFITEVNNIFERQLHDTVNFSTKWNQAKNTKTVNFYHADLVKFLPEYDAVDKTDIWVTNILEYKYTMIKNSKEEYDKFILALETKNLNRIYG